jgi:hypothetical protein
MGPIHRRKATDQRPLREVGINPGMTLEVQPPKQARIIVNPRPFLGAGAEILQFVYAELRDVGGFINRIQNGISELSVESYGTRWVLYDPATGRYLDDIVKGDSRVLWTAGIPNEDGDTFLDVRPPPGQVEQANVWQWWRGLTTELKVAVVAGLFGIVVAIVAGSFNLGVAIFNRVYASPTPTPVVSPVSKPSSSSTLTPAPSLHWGDYEFQIEFADQTAVIDRDGRQVFKFPEEHNVVYDIEFSTDVQDPDLSFPGDPTRRPPHGQADNRDFGHVELGGHTAKHVHIYGAMKKGKGPITALLQFTYLTSGEPPRFVGAQVEPTASRESRRKDVDLTIVPVTYQGPNGPNVFKFSAGANSETGGQSAFDLPDWHPSLGRINSVSLAAQNAEITHDRGNASFEKGDSERKTVIMRGAHWGYVDLYLNRENNTIKIGGAVLDWKDPLHVTVMYTVSDR